MTIGFVIIGTSAHCKIADVYFVTESDRASVLEAVIAHLENDYVETEIGARAAVSLREDARAGKFDKHRPGESFASALGERLQQLTDDGHLNLEFSGTIVADTQDEDEVFEKEQMERWYGAHINFGVQSATRLNGNIGYLDLRVFSPLDMGGSTVVAAMNVLAHTDALVIDLRKNGGGIGDTADLVASYLFGAERQPLTGIYNRRTDELTQHYTQPYVPGARFGAEKPVYVLISEKTFSAAEALAYNLQALKRAVIIGEASGGGAHPFEYLPIHPHFVLWSVTAKSVNPITGGNWQYVGVQPDISVSSEKALDTALAEAKKALNAAQ